MVFTFANQSPYHHWIWSRTTCSGYDYTKLKLLGARNVISWVCPFLMHRKRISRSSAWRPRLCVQLRAAQMQAISPRSEAHTHTQGQIKWQAVNISIRWLFSVSHTGLWMWWQSDINQIHNKKKYVLFLTIRQYFLWVDHHCYHMGSLNSRLL